MVSPRLEQLSEKLLQHGHVSYRPAAPTPSAPSPEMTELCHRLRPFAEAMYLVIAADAEVSERERGALRGALQILTDGLLGGATLTAMLDEFAQARAREGSALRLDAVASALYGDRSDAALALDLAIAVGEVDRGLDERERGVVHELAERLGIASAHVERLLEAEAERPPDTRS